MLQRRDFPDREALANGLADAIAADLAKGIATRGIASLAVSGGSTPAAFFTALSSRDLAWQKVLVTLCDERWVSEDSDRSNARLVRSTLLTGKAENARLVPLWSGGEEPDKAGISATNTALAAVPLPFDAVILGMGSDGHTASFFPGGDTLEAALTAPGPALAIRAPGAGESRVTLTLPVLLNTGALYLHIEGIAKAETLARAQADGPVAEMPVRAVLSQTEKPVTIYWCP
jgi:6-phosphogluconolactonase